MRNTIEIGMKNKITKKGQNMKENINKLSSINILKTLLILYEHQEHIKITAKIINEKGNKEYLYKNEEITQIK